MNKRSKSTRNDQLKSYLTEKPSRRGTASILHPQNRNELLGACKAISGIMAIILIFILCFMGADIAGFYYGTH